MFRCMYAHGAICIAIMPLLADYVEDSTKGRAASLTVIMASGGAMFAAELAGLITGDNISLKTSYISLAGIYFMFSILYALLLKNNFPKNNENKPKR